MHGAGAAGAVAVIAVPDRYVADRAVAGTADQLWPRINTALSTMGRQQLDPLMKDSKPTWISSVQLDRFVFQNSFSAPSPTYPFKHEPVSDGSWISLLTYVSACSKTLHAEIMWHIVYRGSSTV